MITRALAVVCGVAGAATLSQLPEFSQQYLQRLGGQVDALAAVVSDFDASAARSGQTREEALNELDGTPFLEARRADMTRTFARFERLSSDLAMLSNATPVERIFMPQRLRDGEILSGTWAEFRPALPLTAAGAIAAALGFLAAWLGALSALWLARKAVARPAVSSRPLRVEPRLR